MYLLSFRQNLEDEEYLKLFTFYGAIFNAPPDAVGEFTSYLKNQEGLYPRAYNPDEIVQKKKKNYQAACKKGESLWLL